MFLGLFNSLACFEVYINKILMKKLVIFVIIYLYNILIIIKDFSQPDIDAV